MITLKEAYLKAQKEFPDFTLVECIDINDRFAFYFSPDKDAVGIPYVTIDKMSSKVDFLTIPPMKNLRLIRSGKKLNINI